MVSYLLGAGKIGGGEKISSSSTTTKTQDKQQPMKSKTMEDSSCLSLLNTFDKAKILGSLGTEDDRHFDLIQGISYASKSVLLGTSEDGDAGLLKAQYYKVLFRVINGTNDLIVITHIWRLLMRTRLALFFTRALKSIKCADALETMFPSSLQGPGAMTSAYSLTILSSFLAQKKTNETRANVVAAIIQGLLAQGILKHISTMVRNVVDRARDSSGRRRQVATSSGIDEEKASPSESSTSNVQERIVPLALFVFRRFFQISQHAH